MATTHIVNKPDLKNMSKNKKKKLKKKEKQKQKLLEITQQQIQVRNIFSWKMKDNLLLFQDAEKQKQNLLNSPNQINLNKISLSEDVELSTNGHKQTSGDESDDDTQTEQASAMATTDESKPIDPNEPDSVNRRKELQAEFSIVDYGYEFSTTDG